GMGLLLLVLIGFLPAHYALTVNRPEIAPEVRQAAGEIREEFVKNNVPVPDQLARDLDYLERELAGQASFTDLPKKQDTRWEVRQAIFRTNRTLKELEDKPDSLPVEMPKRLEEIRKKKLSPAIEFVPLWVVVGTALALGIGTCIGYKRIVITVAEKIGKTH